MVLCPSLRGNPTKKKGRKKKRRDNESEMSAIFHYTTPYSRTLPYNYTHVHKKYGVHAIVMLWVYKAYSVL